MDPYFEENVVANVFKKTFDNRELGEDKLDQISLTVEPAPQPGELTIDIRVKGVLKEKDAFKVFGGDPYILFSEPIEIPHGGRMAYINGSPMFTQNAKMASISFGTPAGPPKSTGGACPASDLPDEYSKHYALGDVDERPMKYDEQICRKCYANKGNFMYELTQLHQMARYKWLENELDIRKSPDQVMELGDIMATAVRTAAENFKKRNRDGEDPRFVRIHDSGDIFDFRIWRMWKRVCEKLNHLKFWCPTRMWMLPAYTKLFQKEGVPKNLSLRPSAYHFNERAPVIEGMADGTTSHYWEKKLKVDPIKSGIADWRCPAYEAPEAATKEEKEAAVSCRGALERVSRFWTGPDREALRKLKASMTREELELTDGGKTCRVCWLRNDMRVSYKAH